MVWTIFTAALTAAAAASVAVAQSSLPINGKLQAVLDSAANKSLYQYPTSLTQGIVPKPVHSHNDYWRPVPFYSALAAGAISIEADVWLRNDTLYVGHEGMALTSERTFDSLYVQPILEVIKGQNPDNPLAEDENSHPHRPLRIHGVFDTESGQTLYLFVDSKTNGRLTWPHVVEALSPLRNAGYLTTFNGTAVIKGPVTVIGTGKVPLDFVQGVAPRDYFWDCPIPTLGTTFSNITVDVSPICSTNFITEFGRVRRQTFNDTQLALLKQQVKTAHDKGILVRYWNQPGWPIGTRNAIWRTLWDNDVDLINADDLDGAVNLWENEG